MLAGLHTESLEDHGVLVVWLEVRRHDNEADQDAKVY